MNTIGTQNYLNSNNFGPVQQTVAVNSSNMIVTAVPQTFQPMQQPSWQVPPVNSNVHVVPTTYVPMPPLQPNTVYENILANTELLVLGPSGLTQVAPAEYCVSQDGNTFYAPQGWTIMPREEFISRNFFMLPWPEHTQPLTPSTSPSVTPSPSSSRTGSVEAEAVTTAQRKEETPKKALNVKRPHRAKQVKIAEIHEIVKTYCVNQGIFAKEDEVLRGEDVLRIHVKTWEGLDLIESVIQEVESNIRIAKIALPYSMKNKFQKKGFICYLKVQNVRDVPVVQNIFSKHSHAFKKCDVALPTNKIPEKVDQVAKPFNIPFMSPPMMAKRLSAA